MNKKGFTLIEILAVIIFLGIISLIVVATVKRMFQSSKQKLYDEQIILIEDGLKNWASANIFLLPNENETIYISLGQLKQSGHAEQIIKNPKNSKCFSKESILSITKYHNSYIYEAKEIVDVKCDLIKDTPTIKLNGSAVEYLAMDDIYTEMGATAKSSNGTDITDNIVMTVTGSGDSVDTIEVGTYTITYSITSNGKTMTAIRNVFVK